MLKVYFSKGLFQALPTGERKILLRERNLKRTTLE